MTPQERDDMVTGIAHRVLAEKESGRQVDPVRLAWATGVLDFAERGRSDEAPALAPQPQGAAA